MRWYTPLKWPKSKSPLENIKANSVSKLANCTAWYKLMCVQDLRNKSCICSGRVSCNLLKSSDFTAGKQSRNWSAYTVLISNAGRCIPSVAKLVSLTSETTPSTKPFFRVTVLAVWFKIVTGKSLPDKVNTDNISTKGCSTGSNKRNFASLRYLESSLKEKLRPEYGKS